MINTNKLHELIKHTKAALTGEAFESLNELEDLETNFLTFESDSAGRVHLNEESIVKLLSTLRSLHLDIKGMAIEVPSLEIKNKAFETVYKDLTGLLAELVEEAPLETLCKEHDLQMGVDQNIYAGLTSLLQLSYPRDMFYDDILPAILMRDGKEYVYDEGFIKHMGTILENIHQDVKFALPERLKAPSEEQSAAIAHKLHLVNLIMAQMQADELYLLDNKGYSLMNKANSILTSVITTLPPDHKLSTRAENLMNTMGNIHSTVRRFEQTSLSASDERGPYALAPPEATTSKSKRRKYLQSKSLRKDDSLISHAFGHRPVGLQTDELRKGTLRDITKHLPFDKLQNYDAIDIPKVSIHACTSANVEYMVTRPVCIEPNHCVVIQFLGTDGDCRNGILDNIDESAAHNATIVGFNYNLSTTPTDEEIVAQGVALAKQVLTQEANGDPQRLNLDGHSFGGAIAVKVAAKLKEEGINVGVVHDRSLDETSGPANLELRDMIREKLKVPVSSKRAMRRLMKAAKYNFEIKHDWASLNDENKRMYVSPQETMYEALSYRPQKDPCVKEVTFDESDDGRHLQMMRCYEDEQDYDISSKIHLARLRSGTIEVGGRLENAETNKYRFFQQRARLGLELSKEKTLGVSSEGHAPVAASSSTSTVNPEEKKQKIKKRAMGVSRRFTQSFSQSLRDSECLPHSTSKKKTPPSDDEGPKNEGPRNR